MFIKVIKIIFWLIALTLLAFLVDVTFYFSNISNNTDIINKLIINKDNNIYKLFNKNNSLEKLNIKDTNNSLTWIYQKNINFFDKIYFTNLNSFNISNSDWIYNISLKKWVFLLDLNDLIWKYDIKWKWFEIQPKTAWIIFIDNTNPSKIFIFSITSVFKMSFLSLDEKKINSYYMYPHNYLMFDIKNNTFSRLWTDVFRIKTIVKEGFLTENISANLKEWWKLYWLLKWYKNNFLKTSINQIKINYKINSSIFNELKNLRSFSLIWENYITKYFSFFVNDTKKRIYFKQLVLNKLQKLLNSKEKENKLIIDIISNLNSIKKVNKQDYNDLSNIIRWYYNIIIQNNNINNEVVLNNFLPLAWYIKNNDNKYKKQTDLDLYVLLKNIFFWYDFRNNTHIEKNFNDFVNNYFLKLKINNWALILWKWVDLVLLESFLYYLEDYLNNFAFNSKHIDLDIKTFRLNINILDKYFYLNKKIYFSNKKLELINTWLFKNYNLLNSILSFIRNNFFEKQRDLNNLLIPYTKYKLDWNDINKLSNILKNFFKLKDNYISLLKDNSKQRFLYKNYSKLYKKYDEYFLALTSYEKYKVSYNIKQKELADYYIEKHQKVFWINDIKKYLSQFDQANFKNTQITKTGSNNNLFYVDNFNVSNQVFSFYINPDRDYTISNIIIKSAWLDKNKFKDSTYSLEKDRKLWEKQQKYVKADKKAFYDFKYYFKYKFNNYLNNNLVDNISSNNIDKQKESDDESVMIFKRDTLLSKTGEFSSIYDMVKLKYNDVIVKSLDDITLKNFIVYKRIKDHDYNLIFTSKYFIDKDKDKHYFYNPSWIYISFYNVIDWNIRRNLFWWSKLKIWFDINLGDFKEVFNNIFNQLENIKQLYYSINSNLWIYDINMEYLKDWKIIIWFDFNWKNIKIYLSWDKVLFIKEDWKILPYKNISLGQDINKILLKLK